MIEVVTAEDADVETAKVKSRKEISEGNKTETKNSTEEPRGEKNQKLLLDSFTVEVATVDSLTFPNVSNRFQLQLFWFRRDQTQKMTLKTNKNKVKFVSLSLSLKTAYRETLAIRTYMH